MYKLSFILPCYNVEYFITECLDSLLNQDIPYNEYEIICINDCSTDGTRDIILSYQARYENIILIDHTENKTAGGARNSGIDVAKGKYIWFVDPDDMIFTNCLSELLNQMESEQLDILMFNFDAVRETSKNTIEVKDTYQQSLVYSGLDYIEKYFFKQLSKITIVWQQIYRKSHIAEHEILYPEIRVGQDGIFSWQAFFAAKRVQSIDKRFYIHRLNEFSTTAKILVADVLIARYVLFALEVNSILQNSKILPEFIRSDLISTEKWAVNGFCKKVIELSSSETKLFVQYLRREYSRVMKLNTLNRKTRVAMRLARVNGLLFRLFCIKQ